MPANVKAIDSIKLGFARVLRGEVPGDIVVGDCLDVMAAMPDGCVDLVVTSFPFGVGKEYERDQNMGDIDTLVSPDILVKRRDFEREITFDQLLRLINHSFQAWERVVKPGGYVVVEFGNLLKGWKLLGLKEPCEMPMGWIYWAFGLSSGFLLQSQRIWKKRFERIISSRQVISAPRAVLEIEHIYTFRRSGKPGKQTIRNRKLSQRAVWDSAESAEMILKDHPAAFPILLPLNAIEIYTDIGDLVLDPFMGSGTTAVVADRLGRCWFGCDINQDYVEMALKRIEADREKRAQMELL